MSTDATPPAEPPAPAFAGAPDDALRPARSRLPLVLPLLPLLAIAAVWYFTDLSKLRSPEQLAAAAASLRAQPLAFAYVLLAFALGTLLFFPVMALIAGTVLAFDPLRGFTFAFCGTLLGSCITYWAGRLMGAHALDYVSGPRMLKFGTLMRKHAIRASIAARLLPLGNFTGLNLFAGGLRIPFGSYFIGNVIGILPGVLLLTLFAEQLSNALRAPSRENLIYLGIAVVLAVLVWWLLRRRARPAASEAS